MRAYVRTGRGRGYVGWVGWKNGAREYGGGGGGGEGGARQILVRIKGSDRQSEVVELSMQYCAQIF